MRIFLPAAISVALAGNLPAAVVYSGVQNIAIPDTFYGVYLDFTDHTSATAVTVSTGPTVPTDFDINPFFGGSAIANSDTLQPVTLAATVNSDVENLAGGVTVSAANTYPASFSGSTGQIGAAANQWNNGETGYIGFRILDTSFASGPGFTIYGYMQVTLQDDGSAGNIIGWAWETDGTEITIGAIPEPGSMVLLLSGALGLLRRRRLPAFG